MHVFLDQCEPLSFSKQTTYILLRISFKSAILAEFTHTVAYELELHKTAGSAREYKVNCRRVHKIDFFLDVKCV